MKMIPALHPVGETLPIIVSEVRHGVTEHAGIPLEPAPHDIGQTWQLRQLLLSAREVTATKVVSE